MSLFSYPLFFVNFYCNILLQNNIFLKGLYFMIIRRIVEYQEEANNNNMMNTVKKLSNELDTKWDYGVFVDGKKKIDLDGFDFDTFYKTIPIEILKNQKIGLCWDFVNYEHYILDKLGVSNTAYLFHVFKPNNEDITHTFIIFQIGKDKYWLESSAYKKRGIHKVRSYKDVIQELFDMYNISENDFPYSVFEYNPDGLDKNISTNDFINHIEKENNLIYTNADSF